MGSQRRAIAMTSAEIEAFMQTGRTMQVSLNGPDGYPDIVPMWYVFDGASIWMRTYAASQKAVNARRDPRCCVLVETGSHYQELRGVQATGDLQVVEDIDRICWVAARLMVKYEGVDAEHIEAMEQAYRPRADKQVALRLDPVRWVSWDHRKLAT